MPEYLAPGVFIEEVSFRSKSIEGVSTSVAGMAGPTAYGPVRGAPEVLTSYGEFERVFGAPSKLTYGADTYLNHTALAARAFFENGGKQLYVTRVVAGGNDTDEFGAGSSAGTATASSTGGDITFNARFPGSGGNLDLEVIWQDQQNLLKTANLSSFADIPDGAEGLLTISVALDQTAVNTPGTFGGATFSLDSLQVIAVKSGSDLQFSGTNAVVLVTGDSATTNVPIADLGDAIAGTALDALGFSFRRVYATQPDSGALSTGFTTPAELLLNQAVNIQNLTGVDLAGAKILRGTLNDAGTILQRSGPENIPLAALAVVPGAAKSLSVQRDFAIDVIRRKTSKTDTTGTPGEGEPIYQTGVLSLDSTKANYVTAILTQNPEKAADKLTLPIAATISGTPTAAVLHTALFTLFAGNANSLNPPTGSYDEPRYIITISGGSDGTLPIADDYKGETDDKGSTALAALEEVEDVSIVITPAAIISSAQHQAIVSEVEKHCVKMRYRMGIVDSREDMSLSELRTFRDNFDNSRLALYSPWVVVSDPTGESVDISLPPSGFMAGIYARTDVDRGVHKAPANTTVLGALRFHQNINKFQQEVLNPQGINCLRSFAGRGHRVWGGRTMSSDPEWKYVNVRRYFLYLEKSIEKGTQWAVFEPNGEKLWANVTATIESFLFNEWKNGRLLGGKPSAAYFVRCDRSTMTQNDIDNGRLVCEVGVAPLRPAEFVIFRIGQKTADA